MSSTPSRRALGRVLALGLTAVLTAGSLSFASAAAATAAEADSRVTVPIVGLGEVTVSKTKDLADGETITISGRFVAPSSVDRYLINQAGTNYSPAPGGENAILIHEGDALRAEVTTDADAPEFRRFETEYTVRSTLTSRVDGTVFDGLVHQTYLVLGGGWGERTAPDGTTYLASSVQQVNDPLYSSHLVPLSFAGAAAEPTTDAPVAVTEHPASVHAEIGEIVTFEGAGTGSPTAALQWEISENNGESWSPIEGETSESLARRVVLSDDGLQFRLRLSNRISAAYSHAAVVSIDVPEASTPYDPTRFTMVTEGSGGRVTPLTGLVDGQSISIEARYTSVYADISIYEHLAVGQYGSDTSRLTILRATPETGGYAVSGTYAVSRHLTAPDGTTTDCLVAQCYLVIGGRILTQDGTGVIEDPALAASGVYQWINAPISDNVQTQYFPIYFEGTELTPPVPPVQVLPEFTDQPDDVTVAAGYAAQFETVATGEPEPSYQWQRSPDQGATWQTIRGQNAPSMRIPTTEDLTGSWYRVRATNAAGTAYSAPATLTVTPGSDDGNNPGADVSRKGISLDWIGSEELQRRTPAYTPSYYSAGLSEGNKATYKNSEDGTVIVFRPKDGSPERATTFESTFAHLPPTPSDPPTGDLQLVRLNNGIVDRNEDGGGTIRWSATWSINFYGGLVPFSLRNPVLTWDAHGTGTLTADLLGFGSTMENPEIKVPLEPVLGATIATFSNATIGVDGVFSATPDYAGVEVSTPDEASPQDRTAAGWGSWPQEFVDFQFETGLSSYWYTSGLSADVYKAPSPLTVAGLTGFTIATRVPDAPAAPTVTAVSGTELEVSWLPPASGTAITGYTVSAANGDAVTTVEVDGETVKTTVTGLDLGTEYAVTVTAVSAAGASPASAATSATTHGVPSAPAAPTLTSGEGTSLVAAWEAPASDGGSAVTGYDVTLRDGDDIVATRTVAGTSATFEDLARGRDYTATVAARNALGLSAGSEASAPVTVAALAPSAPDAPAVTPGVGSLTVAWAAPAANGSEITGYTVTATPAAGGAPVTEDVTEPTATLTGLVRGGEYGVTVVARNAVGTSDASAATSATTLTAAPSGLGAPAVTPVSDTELLVAWAAPADDGGASLTGYEVTVLRGTEVAVTVTADAEDSSVSVGGLVRGAEYTVTVTAVNATGTVVSPASAAVRTFDVPAAPEVTAALDGPRGVTVTWTAPAETGGSPVTGYVVTVRSGATVLETRTVGADVASVTIDGIAPGAPVTASVVARNVVGDSEAGNAAEVTVPAVAPDAPATPVVRIAGDETVVVTWAAPAVTGGAPITGYRVSLAGPDGVTVTDAAADATSVEIGGLGQGAYTAAVIAVNAVGSSEPSAASSAVKVAGAKPSAQPELPGDGLFDEPSAGDVGATVAGGRITVTVPDREGEWVGLSIHSDPQWLGWHRVTNGIVTIDVPAGLSGAHRVVVHAADGSVIGYAAVQIDPPVAAAPDGRGAAAAGTGLPRTGSDVDSAWSLFALLLLAAGAGAVVVGRRRVRRS